MSGPHLVNSPDADSFREMAGIEHGRKALLGDTEKLPAEARAWVNNAEKAVVAGLDKVARLPNDPTKTLVVQHETGRVIANNTIAVVEDSKARLDTFGRSCVAEAQAAFRGGFELKPDRQFVYDRIVNWINSKASTPEGTMKIRQASKTDPDVIRVLSNIPSYIFDLAPDVREKIILDGYVHHMPEVAERMVEGNQLIELAGKYDRVVKGIRASFYNSGLADQASRRIDP